MGMLTEESTMEESAPVSEGSPSPATESGEPTTPPTSTGDAPAAPQEPALPEWKSSLPDEIKMDPSLSHIGDVETLAKSYVHAQKMVGADKILIPQKNAPDEDWQNVFRKLGLPESKDEYELQVGEGADKELLDSFKDKALELGVLPKQAQGLLEWMNGNHEKQLESQTSEAQAKAEQARKDLERDWGQDFDKNLSAAKAVLREYGDDDVVKYLEESGLGDDPNLIRFLSKVGGNLLEDSIQGGRETVQEHPEQIQTQINDILGNPQHPYNNASHPNHAHAVREVQKMFERMTSA